MSIRNSIIHIQFPNLTQFDVEINPLPMTGLQKHKFYNGNVYLPYYDYLQFRQNNLIAQIPVQQLAKYPNYKHNLQIQLYNQQFPFNQTQKILLILNFLNNQNNKQLNIIFNLIRANITHDTQFLAKMSPYVIIKANGIQKYRSQTIKKGDKNPQFNNQRADITILNLNDQIQFQLWDQDMRKDDLIGKGTMRASQLINRTDQINLNLTYQKKQTKKHAGMLKFTVNTPNII